MKLRDELKYLTTIVRSRIAKDMGTAVDFGDLRENASYDTVSAEMNFNESRIEEILSILRYAKPIKEKISKEIIGIGSKVKLKLKTGKLMEVVIVGEGEGDPAHHKIGADTPLAQAILGKACASRIKIKLPAGLIEYEIKDITFIA